VKTELLTISTRDHGRLKGLTSGDDHTQYTRQATGQYTGDGAAPWRQIPTGFKCGFVYIQGAGLDKIGISVQASRGLYCVHNGSPQIGGAIGPNLHATDGFEVSGVYMNDNTVVFDYMAIEAS